MYISRDINGKINGVYLNPQEGYAEENLEDTNVELEAFINQAVKKEQS